MSDQSDVSCAACSRHFRWKPELAGKKAKCKCGQSIVFPKEDPALAVAARGGGDLDLLDETIEEAVAPPVSAAAPVAHAAAPAARSGPPPRSAGGPPPIRAVAAPPAQPAMKACKGCSTPLPPEGVLCTRCGLNQISGKYMSTAVKGPGMEAGEVAVAAGKFVLSMVVGGVTALIGAAIWVAIIYFTGYEVGIVAWIIGAMVGFAMQLVNKNGGMVAGLAAGGFALLAVAGPKVLILALIPDVDASDLFGPFDFLWMALAASSAFKLAYGEKAAA